MSIKMNIIGIGALFLIAMLSPCANEPVRGFHLYVDTIVPRYALYGSDISLYCDFKVKDNEVHKVEWYQHHKKVFQYINHRKPQYINYTIVGAQLDWKRTTNRRLALSNIGFEAAGVYFCDLALLTPMYSKSATEKVMSVIQRQVEDPQIVLGKPKYAVGELLEANCTSGKANPTPDIMWLVNGIPVHHSLMIPFPEEMTEATKVKLNLSLTVKHQPQVLLSCLSTIPYFIDVNTSSDEYADYRVSTVAVPITKSGAGYAVSAEKKMIFYAAIIPVVVAAVFAGNYFG